MLETPKALNTTTVTMSEICDKIEVSLMDNQQAIRLAQTAALYDGEGSFFIVKAGSKGRRQFHAEIAFGNTDYALIKFVSDVLTENGIHHKIHSRNTGHKKFYNVGVWRLKEVAAICDLLQPYLIGYKKEQARIISEFAKASLARWNSKSGTWHGIRFTPEEKEQFSAMADAVRSASETTRLAPAA